MFGRVKNITNGLKCLMHILSKRIVNRQLVFCIYTPYYGNVGDHTIELAEQEILCECGFSNRIIDISSYEYHIVKKILPKFIHDNDILIIDGGGNFGDTWEGTLDDIITIVNRYLNNRIIVFPESWYFSSTDKGLSLLKRTSEVFSNKNKMIIYARDYWSYNHMKKNISKTEICYCFDCAFYKKYTPKKKCSGNTIGICIREDKESINHRLFNQIMSDIKEYWDNYEEKIIRNDSYSHIDKKERNQYFHNIISQYENCNLIITDRFHGFVFSIISHTPCIIFDNSTGKIGHFYDDISEHIEGCIMISGDDYKSSDIHSILMYKEMKISVRFMELVEKNREMIKKDIINWRDVL